mgnify:FL=1
MSLSNHLQVLFLMTLNIDYMVDLTIFKGLLVFILVDIIIGQLKYFMRDLHLIQVIFGIAAVLLDSLESHPPLVFLLESVYDGNLRQSTLLARR